MWLRSERRERRLRRTRPIKFPINIKKKSLTPNKNLTLKNKNNKIVTSKCNNISNNNPRLGVKRLIKNKTSTNFIKIVKNDARKLPDNNCNDNCWLETTEITLFEQTNKLAAAHSVIGPKVNINYDTDVSSDPQFVPILLNAESNSSIISCCSCDAEGLSSSKHEISSSSLNVIKCISECDSTTGFDSDDTTIIQNDSGKFSLKGDNQDNDDFDCDEENGQDDDRKADAIEKEQSIFDIIVPQVDSTTDLHLTDKKSREIPKLVLPSMFNHSFPTPDITPSMKQFPCYNNLGNNYSTSSDVLISFFDDVINKNSTPEVVNQFNDYIPYDSYFTQNDIATNVASHTFINLDQSNDLSYLSMNQTSIDNLKALSNFQTSNFLTINERNPDGCSNDVHDNETFIQNIQPPQITSATEDTNSNTEIINQHTGLTDANEEIRLETDECMEIEEIDTRQVLSWNSFDPYVFIKNLPPLTSDMRAKCPALPLKTRSSPEFTLVLDLDETLVHCSLQELSDASFKFPVLFQDCKYTVFVRTRPYFREFLEQVSKLFEVILFTASKRVYADKLLNLLDPDRKWIKYRLFREHCVLVNGNYIKDLTILGRDLSKTIIIDNSPQAFGYQLENGIPIESWFMDQNDSELMKLVPFLEELANLRQDVRPHIREKFRLFSYLPPD